MNRAEKNFLRGKASKDLEHYAAEIEDFSKAIELAPPYLKDFLNRSKCFEQLEDIAASEKFFDKPTDNKPIDDATDNFTDEQLIHAWQNFAVPTLGHGKCSFDLGEFDVALKDFDTVIATVPTAKNLFYIEYDGWDYYAFLDDMIDDLEKYFEPIINSRTFDEFNFNRVLVVLAYVGRRQCHKNFGDESKAQADFAEVKTLGFAVDNFDALKPILDI